MIGLHLVVILGDSGSTHSFLDPGVAKLTRLKNEATSLQVKVANGEKLLSKEDVRTLWLRSRVINPFFFHVC